MRRHWITISVAAALGALTLAPGALAADRQPVTLQLVNVWNGSRIPLMETVLARFHEKYPWITVENVVASSGTFSKSLAAIAAGAPPDVMMVDRLRLAEFAEAQVLQPLDPFIKQDGFDMSMFYRPEVEASRYNGHTYVLPMPSASLGLLYYNRGMFADSGLDPDAPPTTWQQMTDLALRLTRTDAAGNLQISGGSIGYFPRYRMAQLGYLNGEQIFQDDGLTVNYLAPGMIEAANWAADFVKRVPQGGSVQNGSRAMETNGEWYYFYIKSANPNLDAGIAPLPHGPSGESVNVVGAAWSFGVPVGVKHPYESWLLVKFLTSSEEGAKYFTLEQGRPSPVIRFNQDRRYYAQNPYWDVIGQTLSTGVVPKRSPLSQRIVDVDIKWYGELMKGSDSPKGVLTSLQNEVDAMIRDYRAHQD